MDRRKIEIYDGGTPVSKVYVENNLTGLTECLGGTESVFLVYDRNVTDIALDIRSIVKTEAEMGLEVSEETKSVETVVKICSWLLDAGADRTSFLLAVGGGILTDMAGFAAAVYKRGIRVAYIPTTLLSQVDAAIGGKTGVNLASYKNMIGVIRQPEFTYICISALQSLPERDLRAGVAEMLKTFIIRDNGYYRRAVDFFSSRNRVRAEDLNDIAELVYAAAKVKADVVSSDQFEGGIRRKLNLGHTFAHAIEWCGHSDDSACDYSFSHGQAVSVGMVLAARLSEVLGIAAEGLAETLERDLSRCGLPVSSPFPVAELADAMEKDKKAENGRVHFVLIRHIGDVVISDLAVNEVVRMLE